MVLKRSCILQISVIITSGRLTTLRLNQLTWAVNLLLICYHPCRRSPFIIIIIHSKSWYWLHHPVEDRRLSHSACAQDCYITVHCCDKGNCCNEMLGCDTPQSGIVVLDHCEMYSSSPSVQDCCYLCLLLTYCHTSFLCQVSLVAAMVAVAFYWSTWRWKAEVWGVNVPSTGNQLVDEERMGSNDLSLASGRASGGKKFCTCYVFIPSLVHVGSGH